MLNQQKVKFICFKMLFTDNNKYVFIKYLREKWHYDTKNIKNLPQS